VGELKEERRMNLCLYAERKRSVRGSSWEKK
jgi:hypothetical protein